MSEVISFATAQELTIEVCSVNFLVRVPRFASQHATVLSAEHEIIVVSIGQCTCNTAFLCPLSTL